MGGPQILSRELLFEALGGKMCLHWVLLQLLAGLPCNVALTIFDN
jgi:hypothetical protein